MLLVNTASYCQVNDAAAHLLFIMLPYQFWIFAAGQDVPILSCSLFVRAFDSRRAL